MTGEETLNDMLEELRAGSDGVRAIFLASVQGKFLASTEMTGLERFRLGRISAASLAIGGKGIEDLMLGELNQIHSVGSAGSILLVRVGDEAVLTLVLDIDCQLEEVVEGAQRAVPQLEAAI